MKTYSLPPSQFSFLLLPTKEDLKTLRFWSFGAKPQNKGRALGFWGSKVPKRLKTKRGRLQGSEILKSQKTIKNALWDFGDPKSRSAKRIQRTLKLRDPEIPEKENKREKSKGKEKKRGTPILKAKMEGRIMKSIIEPILYVSGP